MSRTPAAMRLRFAVPVLAFLFALGARPADRIGAGIATVEVNAGVELDLFAAPGDSAPVATVRIREDEANLTVVLDPATPDWLRPETLWLDYSLFAFRVLTATAEAFEVVVDEESGRTLWLRAQPGVEYKPWAQYLVENVTWIEPLDSTANPLRVAPDADAAGILYDGPQGPGCLAVAEVRGEWARVTRSDLCEPADAAPVEGWVQWRAGDALLIGYGLTC